MDKLRKAFEDWCDVYCSPGAKTSDFYWQLWKGGAEHERQQLSSEYAWARKQHEIRDDENKLVINSLKKEVKRLEKLVDNNTGGDNLSFDGNGRVSVDVNKLVRSPRVQEQVQAVREFAARQNNQSNEESLSDEYARELMFVAGDEQPKPSSVETLIKSLVVCGKWEESDGEPVKAEVYYDAANALRQEWRRAEQAEKQQALLESQVEHWREARQNALVGGDVLLKEVKELREDNARLQKAHDYQYNVAGSLLREVEQRISRENEQLKNLYEAVDNNFYCHHCNAIPADAIRNAYSDIWLSRKSREP